MKKIAFYGTNLSTVTIPNSVKECGDSAFGLCKNLKEIIFLNPECKIYFSNSTISNEAHMNGHTSIYNYNGIIKGYENSTAQEYAEHYGYKFNIFVSSETTNWQQLYADELKRYMASDEYNNETMFDLYDVNNDNIPELFISTGVSHADGCLIYTVLNEKIQKLEKYYELAGCGEYGLINCSSSIQTIFSSWSKSGNYFMDYYQIQNDKFVHILEAYNDTANVGLENATYKINNETVTVEKYNEEISKYEADDYIEVGRKYKLDEETINSILLSEE